MSETKEPVACEICIDRKAVITVIVGIHAPSETPLCGVCAKDAINNPDQWFLYVPTEEVTNA